MGWLPWREAWQQALYGANGFYRCGAGPAGHFATALQAAPEMGSVLASALVTWLGSAGLTGLVDVGAGRGELLRRVHALMPAARCVGVEVVDRPALPDAIEWVRSPGGAALPDELSGLSGVLVLAHEWLDVVPCRVCQVDRWGAMREVEVRDDGRERLGGELPDADLAWCRRHWPDAEPGDRVEVGTARDDAFAALTSRTVDGVVVAVDYGHLRAGRPGAGTLTGYRHGRAVPPTPDGTCDLTAHVAVDSLPADMLLDQRQALRRLGVATTVPGPALAAADPQAYLRRLARVSAGTALMAPAGFGGFWWALRHVGSAARLGGPGAAYRPSHAGTVAQCTDNLPKELPVCRS
ncbi:MAG TPA: SAM-dependent methyltransferase [Dermatophilaceae bacterium]|nr:SAM-dependent methyltransferase [Dermatophilaceae bacterium]